MTVLSREHERERKMEGHLHSVSYAFEWDAFASCAADSIHDDRPFGMHQQTSRFCLHQGLSYEKANLEVRLAFTALPQITIYAIRNPAEVSIPVACM